MWTRLFADRRLGRRLDADPRGAVPRRSPRTPGRRSPRSSGRAKNLEAALAGGGLGRRQPGGAPRRRARRRDLRPAALPVPRPAGRDHRRAARRRDRARPGASGAAASRRCCGSAARRPGRIVRLAAAEAMLVGGLGTVVGSRAARRSSGRLAFGTSRFGATTHARRPRGSRSRSSFGLGLVVRDRSSLPAWRDARTLTVRGAQARRRSAAPSAPRPVWARLYLDVLCLGARRAHLLAGGAQRLPGGARARRRARRSR